MPSTKWKSSDERLLERYYEYVGASWLGWRGLFPDLGEGAIRFKAMTMELAYDHTLPPLSPRMVDNDVILRMFRGGLAPSQIDRLFGLRMGSAHEAVVCWWADCKAKANGR